MSKNEIEELLKQIKVFYPRFDGAEKTDGGFRILPEVCTSWFRQIGFMSLERALQILNQHIRSEDGSKTPHVSLWIAGGDKAAKAAACTAVFDRRTGCALWKPRKDVPTQEIQLSWNNSKGAYMDAWGRLWAFPDM